jgi:tetratricopeptide (TPR) repeat protein
VRALVRQAINKSLVLGIDKGMHLPPHGGGASGSSQGGGGEGGHESPYGMGSEIEESWDATNKKKEKPADAHRNQLQNAGAARHSDTHTHTHTHTRSQTHDHTRRGNGTAGGHRGADGGGCHALGGGGAELEAPEVSVMLAQSHQNTVQGGEGGGGGGTGGGGGGGREGGQHSPSEQEKASENEKKCLIADDKSADYYHSKGYAHRKRGDFEKAMFYYSVAVGKDPSHFKALSSTQFAGVTRTTYLLS